MSKSQQPGSFIMRLTMQAATQRLQMEVKQEGRSAIFLDRDGTINIDRGYLADPNQVELIQGASTAIKRFKKLGFLVVIITNQAGIGKKVISASDFASVNTRLWLYLRELGASYDALYYCPHSPELTQCNCRKPAPGLLFQAAVDFCIDLNSSYMIGDKLSDVQAGKNASCSSILIASDRNNLNALGTFSVDFVADNLYKASTWISNNRTK